MRLSDSQVLSICAAELQETSTHRTGELVDQRADAMERYLGEKYGNEAEGRSQVRTREVFDTIEWIKPSLLRLFADADNLVDFEPVGPEDEDQAKQETELCNHIFWKKNRGFYNLYTFITDGLLSKTGILKAWWDDSKDEEREEYEGLDPMAVAELMNDAEWDREVIEYEQHDDGTFDVVFRATRDRGRVVIEPCPPEEFGVSRNARSPYAKDAGFVWHRTPKTRTELIEAGYSRKKVEALPSDDDVDGQERQARYNIEGEHDTVAHSHKSMERVWVTECYLRLDRNDDGIAELLKVTLAGGSGEAAGELLDVEETDRIPFSTFSPVLLTHKFHGLSIADIVMDLQEIKTALLRGSLDAMYLANNPRTAVNERVNLDDLLTSRPGGIVRTEGNEPPGQHIFPVVSQPVPQETFGLLEYLDQLRKDRTGSGDNVPSLDKNSLANINPSVAAIAYDAARAKIELLARIIAEIGLLPLFRDIHELTSKHSHRDMAVRLRGGWVKTSPSEWRNRENLTVKVGIGLASRERRLMTLEQVITKQMEIGGNGGMGQLVGPEHIYRSLSDWTDALGAEPSLYWMDPSTAQPQPPQPDPQQMLIQAQMQIEGAKDATAQKKLQLDAMRLQTEQQIKIAEFQVRREEAAAKQEVERLKTELQVMRASADAQNAGTKAFADAQKVAKESELKSAELALRDAQERARVTMDWHKAALASSTTLTVEQMRHMGMGDAADRREADDAVRIERAQSEDADKVSMRDAIGNLTAMLQELTETSRSPKRIERDAAGRAISIGGMPIKRNAQDLIESIG